MILTIQMSKSTITLTQNIRPRSLIEAASFGTMKTVGDKWHICFNTGITSAYTC